LKSLFTLRKWLTVDEAAKHLSVLFDEPVANAELLRLALEGELRLSVLFVNHARAKRGRIVSVDEARTIESAGPNGEKIFTLQGEFIDDGRVMELESEIQILTGVFDLPMVGAEELDVEHEYQMLTGGPAVELTVLTGAFVCNDDVYWQVQEHYSKNEYMTAEDLKKPWDNPKNFYPAGKLPDDVVYVVRPTALSDLLAKVQATQGGASSVQKDSERAQAATKRAGGRRMSDLWPSWVAELVFHIHENGFPAGEGAVGQDALIATVETSLIQRGGEAPSRTTVQGTVRAVLARYRSVGK
jgi:hypothetical protein